MIPRTLSVVLIVFTLTSCLASLKSKQSGWWGSKQDKSVISQADIQKFVGKVRPIQRDADFHFRQGIYFQSQERHAKAAKEFANALQKDPEHIRALNGLGISSDKLGDFQSAVLSYQAALELDPDLDYVHNNLGYSYLLQGNYSKAEKHFKKAVTLNSDYALYQYNLGLAYTHQGLFQKALAQFQGPLSDDTVQETEDAFIEPALNKAEDTRSPAASKQPRSISKLDANTAGKQASEEAPLELTQSREKQQTRETVSQVTYYAVQVGAYQQQQEASETYFKLLQNDYQVYITPPLAGSQLYRVRVGQYGSLDAAQKASTELSRVENMESYALQENLLPSGVSETALFKDDTAGANQGQVGFEQDTSWQSRLQDIYVDVLNGNGQPGMAARLGAYLEMQGVRASRIRNADHFGYLQTSIYYKPGDRQAAEILDSLLPGGEYSLREVNPLAIPNAVVRLVFGHDMAQHNQKLQTALEAEAKSSKK